MRAQLLSGRISSVSLIQGFGVGLTFYYNCDYTNWCRTSFAHAHATDLELIMLCAVYYVYEVLSTNLAQIMPGDLATL